MFADSARIFIKSGRGGDGHVSFRRELYVPAGGPDGGDGGRGGDIIFEVDRGLNTLADFRHIKKYKAAPGENGGKKHKHGKDGESLVIKVPEGTIIKDDETGMIITDMSGDNRREVLLKGGRGGKGNQNYATATMQAPKYAQPGGEGRELWIRLELKLIADVGLAGYPNAGKSTLLSRVSNARPKIADYPFTTLNPHLGVVDFEDAKGFVMADIPGLIKGASEGIGLGHEFLKHIERTKVIIHVVDAAGTEGRDPADDIITINEELKSFNPDLLKRPQIIAANKMDAVYDAEIVDVLKKRFEPEGIRVFPISAVSGMGIKELLYAVREILDNFTPEPVIFEREFFTDMIVNESTEPFTVEKTDDGVFSIEGPRIEKMLGYTNLEAEKGFIFFQKFLKENGILNELENLGIRDGDTVKMYGHEFDYYK